MDVSQIKQNAQEVFNTIQIAQQQKNDTANQLIKMAVSEKVGGNSGNSPYTGHVIDITS